MKEITSTFALLDVKKGREQLFRLLGYAGKEPSIPVVITGEITHAWGGDDGTSREFAVNVTGVTLGEPKNGL